MTSLTAPLSQHHHLCDSLYAEAENAARSEDWDTCLAVTRQFVEQTLAHFSAEEEALFPAFEAATGHTGGPTAVMRQEHAMMRELFDELQQAAVEHNADLFEGCCSELLILMQQHNLKEENILYPMCDRSVSDDAVATRLNALAQGAHHG